VDAVKSVITSKYPVLSTTVPQGSRNYLKVSFVTFTASRRRLKGEEEEETDGRRLFTAPGFCSPCTIEYTISLTCSEIISQAGPYAAFGGLGVTLNNSISSGTFQTYMRASSFATSSPNAADFLQVQAQQAVTLLTQKASIDYKRSKQPSPAPTHTPGPTVEKIVATKGTGLYIMVSLLGAFAIVVVVASVLWVKRKAELKIKEAKRLKALDKWSKLPRNVTHDKDPEFFNIYGGYAGTHGPSESKDDGKDETTDEWQKKYSKDNGRPYWVNKRTKKTTFKKPVSSKRQLDRSVGRRGGFDDEEEPDDDIEGNYSDPGSPRDFFPSSSSSKPGSKRYVPNTPKLSKGLSVPVRVKASLEFQDGYNKTDKINASADYFRPPLLPRDVVKEAARVPDKNLWFERYSKRHNRIYWRHQVTNEVTWKPPEELDYYKTTTAAKRSPSASGGGPSPIANAASPWTPKESRKYGMTYWTHESTGEVRWENPDETPGGGGVSAYHPPPSSSSRQMGGSRRGAPVEEDHPPPSSFAQGELEPETWVEKMSAEHGVAYYKNPDKGTISWTRPEGDHVTIVHYSEFKRARSGGRTPPSRVKTTLNLDD